ARPPAAAGPPAVAASPARLPEGGRDRGRLLCGLREAEPVDADAVEQTRVALAETPGRLRPRGRSDRPLAQQLVVDRGGQRRDLAASLEAVQPLGQLPPAVRVEHRTVGRGGGVEGDLLPHRALVAGEADEDRAGEDGTGPPRAERRERHLAQVA